MRIDKIVMSLKLFIVVSLLVLMVFGCKGKDQQQTPAGVTSTETAGVQQGKEPASAPGEAGPSVTEPGTETAAPGAAAPRILSLDLSPRMPVIGDSVKAIVKTTGTEEYPVNIQYQWSHNDVLLSEESDSLLLAAADFKKGDKVTLRVIPDSGNRKGAPMTIVLTVANAAPVIKSSQTSIKFDGNTYTYQVKASDPDGDPVSISLITAPEGMTISQTGFIQWAVPQSVKGQIPVTVSVTDGQGGETLQNFTLEIRQR